MMEYIQKAIDELLALLYNSSSALTAEQQAHYIAVVIGLDYPHVPELFMLQNALQTWRNSITYSHEKLLKWRCGARLRCSACELERIDLQEVHGASRRRVVVGLLLQYVHELDDRYKDTMRKCKEVLYVGVAAWGEA